MSADIAISVVNVSKAYRIWENPGSRLMAPLQAALARLLPGQNVLGQWLKHRASRKFRDFWALRNISFEIRRGESVGVIGRNGSGKSTLLQIISGTLQPTKGTMRVNGRVAALLELGSGFNPEFTGRENVYLNAAVLGLNRAETDARFEAMAAFADIGDFIDQPVKTYSSGMMVRLAFAVQTAVDPDVLIIDEALAVGDIFFQQKCFRRLRELKEGGATLLFVSHDMGSVANLCSRALWLAEGGLRQLGPSEQVTRGYLLAGGATSAGRNASGAHHGEDQGDEPIPDSFAVDISGCSRLGNQQIRITGLWLGEDTAGSVVQVGKWLELAVLIAAERDVTDVSVGFEIRDRLGQVMAANGLRVKGLLIPRLQSGEKRLVRMRLQNLLAPGTYTLDVGCGDSSSTDNACDRVVGALLLESSLPSSGEPVHGFYRIPADFVVTVPRA